MEPQPADPALLMLLQPSLVCRQVLDVMTIEQLSQLCVLHKLPTLPSDTRDKLITRLLLRRSPNKAEAVEYLKESVRRVDAILFELGLNGAREEDGVGSLELLVNRRFASMAKRRHAKRSRASDDVVAPLNMLATEAQQKTFQESPSPASVAVPTSGVGVLNYYAPPTKRCKHLGTVTEETPANIEQEQEPSLEPAKTRPHTPVTPHIVSSSMLCGTLSPVTTNLATWNQATVPKSKVF